MKHSKKHFFLTLILIASALLLINCQEKEEVKKSTFVKPPVEKLDSLDKWFANHENYKKKNFLPDFYVHFNKKIADKQWNEAAQFLRGTLNNLVVNRGYDSLLVQTSINFLQNYDSKVSTKYKAGINVKIAEIFYYNSDYKKAIAYSQKVIKMPSSDSATLNNIATAHRQLSYIDLDRGKYDNALKEGLEALKISQKNNNKFGIGAACGLLGGVYRKIDDFDKSDFYYKKAIENLTSSKNKHEVFPTYLNRINLYAGRDDQTKYWALIDSMYSYYKKNNLTIESYKFKALGLYSAKLLHDNKLEEARQLLDELGLLFGKSNQKEQFYYYLNAALIYEEKTGKNLVSTKVIEALLPYYKEKNNLPTLVSFYDFLIEKALFKNDYKTAFFYVEDYNIIYDSLYNENMVAKTKELDKKYQTAQKEQKIVLQKKEIEQKNTSIALLISSITGLFLLVVAYYLWQKQKTLKQQKANSMNFTKQLLENTEDERKRIASDLHDSISHELLGLKSIFTQDLTTINTKIDSIINDVRSISRNLHPVMFDKIGLQPNLEAMVERMQIQHNFMVSTDIDYTGCLGTVNELQIYRIVQEALTNIIKYAKAHAAKITMTEGPIAVDIEIRDNGHGFNVKEALNSGKAFGLYNIIERSRVIGGEASIVSAATGTVININIPKTQP